MVFSEAEISTFLFQYFLPFCRVSAMFMVMPVFGSKIVTPRVRLVIGFLISILVVPLLPALPQISVLSIELLVIVLQEVLLGVLVGFVFQVVFQVFILAGQLMAMKMGLGFASMNDPTNGVQTTVLSQFYLMITTLVFVSVDGHLILVSFIVESFNTLPPGGFVLSQAAMMNIAGLGTWLFGAALLFALPVLTSLLFVNIAFGVMSRAAPQLNIFAIGFPFTLVCGLILVWLGLTGYMESFEKIMEYGFSIVSEQLKL